MRLASTSAFDGFNQKCKSRSNDRSLDDGRFDEGQCKSNVDAVINRCVGIFAKCLFKRCSNAGSTRITRSAAAIRCNIEGVRCRSCADWAGDCKYSTVAASPTAEAAISASGLMVVKITGLTNNSSAQTCEHQHPKANIRRILVTLTTAFIAYSHCRSQQRFFYPRHRWPNIT